MVDRAASFDETCLQTPQIDSPPVPSPDMQKKYNRTVVVLQISPGQELNLDVDGKGVMFSK